MPDKKLTDNEIVKALECAIRNDCDCNCVFLLPNKVQDVLDLINRLQAENERLKFVRTRDAQRYKQKISDQAHTNCILIDLHSEAIKEVKELEEKLKTAKAEAYKEFAERLKAKFESCFRYDYVCVHGRIDNLLKEIGGEFNDM